MFKNQIMYALLITNTLLVASCGQFKREVSSTALSEEIDEILNRVEWKKAGGNLSQCSALLMKSYDEINELNTDNFSVGKVSKAKIDELVKKSFQLRLSIKDSLEIYKKEKECLRASVDLNRSLRYLEDYLLEYRYKLYPEEALNLTSQAGALLVNDKYSDSFKSFKDLKSGDIILARGNRFISATIARISLSDHQFSHLAMVYIDEKTKKMETIEAHIEIGSVVEDLDFYLKSGSMRSLILRHKDSAYAHKAAKLVRDRVKSFQDKDKNIKYDFAMDAKDHTKLFCSEVASYAFELAGGKYKIPEYRSRFSAKSVGFLNSIGIPVTEKNVNDYDVVAPGDYQYDSNFDIVAEWRNPKITEENRFSDHIMVEVFRKVEEEGYRFDKNFKISAKARLSWILRRTPLANKLVKEKLPTNMTAAQIRFVLALDEVGLAVREEMMKRRSKYAYQMNPKEIYKEIDAIFKEDKEKYEEYQKAGRLKIMSGGEKKEKAKFYPLFHP